MSRFEKVPSDLANDYTLTLQARAVYPILLGAAWKAGARAGERVELPPLHELATACGCAASSLKGYISELRHAGWVETIRAARGRPQMYVIHAVRGLESGPQNAPRGTKSGPRVVRNPAHSRAREDSTTRQRHVDKDTPLPPVPSLSKVDGHDVALDALCDALGIDRKSPRIRQAVVAMNGRDAQPGIRHLFWEECCRYAAERDQTDRLAAIAAGGEPFERALEQRIHRKVALIRERQSWRTYIAPSTVRDLWLDIEHEASGGGLTAAQMEAMEITP